MKVLFLTLLDFDSLEEKGIYTDLLQEFVKKGHEIYIVSPTEKRQQKKTHVLSYKNYKILKLRIGNIQKTNLIEKGISTLLLENQIKKGISKYFKDIKFDFVIYSTPPITWIKAIEFIKKRDNAKSYLLLKDIFPQNALDMGLLKKKGLKGLIYKHFRKIEKRLYLCSDYIGCMSKANVNYILEHNPELDPSRVEICPNSITPIITKLTEEQKTEIKAEYGIYKNRTTFIYGGNLGKPQGIDFLIECLKANLENKKVQFIIVGSGTEYAKIDLFLKKNPTDNIILLKHLPKEEYDRLLNSCDVGLIFLDKNFTIPNFPSRMLSYMENSMPVLAATDKNTDVGKVIVNGKFGLWCESKDVDDFNGIISVMLDKEKVKKMGEQSYKYLIENYTVQSSCDIILNHFLEEESNV